MKQKVIVLGSINKDLVSFVEKHPNIGETINANKFEKFNGGKGANQALAIARLGTPTTMIGAVGNDSIGKEMVLALEKENIKVENIFTKQTNTGMAIITVDNNSSNSIIVHPGANHLLDKNDIDNSEEIIKENKIFVTQLENKPEIILEGLKLAHKYKLVTVLTPAPASGYDERLLEYVNILTPNEHEFKTIFNLDCTKENFKKICNQYPKKTFIVTLGENGVMFMDNNTPTILPIKKVKAIDTTAAGDAFVGGFIFGLSQEHSIKESIKFGIKVAAVSVTKEGAQSSLPTLKEVEDFEWKKQS